MNPLHTLPKFAEEVRLQRTEQLLVSSGQALKPLRALGESGEERTLNQPEEALRHARGAQNGGRPLQAVVECDIDDLLPTLEQSSDLGSS
jgi:hypothetical protein